MSKVRWRSWMRQQGSAPGHWRQQQHRPPQRLPRRPMAGWRHSVLAAGHGERSPRESTDVSACNFTRQRERYWRLMMIIVMYCSFSERIWLHVRSTLGMPAVESGAACCPLSAVATDIELSNGHFTETRKMWTTACTHSTTSEIGSLPCKRWPRERQALHAQKAGWANASQSHSLS